MKTKITIIKKAICIWMIAFPFLANAQTRYLDNVFPSVTVTPNVLYGHNITVLTGTPVDTTLLMDVYTPFGDTCTSRPVVIYLHAGTYLPIIYNRACVGTKSDSSVVEICKQFAKKGYVAIAMDYRLGWDANAIGVNTDLVTGTLFQAAYRSIQDAKACVRFLKGNAPTYGIDTTKIALGGVGAGAITALNYIALHDTIQLWNQKLVCNCVTPTPPFTAGMPYIDFHTLGDFDGFGGVPQFNNPNNSVGHSSDVQMVFSIYGEIGDSTWISTSFPPTVALHPRTPPTGGGPFHWGTLYAGNTGFPILPDVSGPHQYICDFNANGVNNVFTNLPFSDPYSARANAINSGCEGLFPFETSGLYEDVWDWYDSTTMCFVAQAIGLTCQDGLNAYYGSVATNPNMTKTQALAYIDTIQNFLAPRLVRALHPDINNCSTVGIESPVLADESILLFPNPAHDKFSISSKDPSANIRKVELLDVSGRLVFSKDNLKTNAYHFPGINLQSGIYFVKIKFDSGEVIRKITLQ